MIFNVNFDETESHATIIATASAMVKSSTFPAPFTDYNIEFLLNFALPKKCFPKPSSAINLLPMQVFCGMSLRRFLVQKFLNMMMIIAAASVSVVQDLHFKIGKTQIKLLFRL